MLLQRASIGGLAVVERECGVDADKSVRFCICFDGCEGGRGCLKLQSLQMKVSKYLRIFICRHILAGKRQYRQRAEGVSCPRILS